MIRAEIESAQEVHHAATITTWIFTGCAVVTAPMLVGVIIALILSSTLCIFQKY